MAKTVFRPNEVKAQKGEVMLKLVHDFKPVEEKKVEKAPEYTGPTADDLRREAEEYKENWEAEKKRLLDEAQASADEIVRKAEQAAFAEVKRQTDEANIIKADAQKNAEEIVKKAQEAAQEIVRDAESQRQKVESDAYKKGFDEGHESGYRDGEAEANRLIERMHAMLEAVMRRREEILRDTETQIVELVILMTRKVVKIISENQKSVIMSNVLAALKKVKGRRQAYDGTHRRFYQAGRKYTRHYGCRRFDGRKGRLYRRNRLRRNRRAHFEPAQRTRKPSHGNLAGKNACKIRRDRTVFLD